MAPSQNKKGSSLIPYTTFSYRGAIFVSYKPFSLQNIMLPLVMPSLQWELWSLNSDLRLSCILDHFNSSKRSCLRLLASLFFLWPISSNFSLVSLAISAALLAGTDEDGTYFVYSCWACDGFSLAWSICSISRVCCDDVAIEGATFFRRSPSLVWFRGLLMRIGFSLLRIFCNLRGLCRQLCRWLFGRNFPSLRSGFSGFWGRGWLAWVFIVRNNYNNIIRGYFSLCLGRIHLGWCTLFSNLGGLSNNERFCPRLRGLAGQLKVGLHE